jgi:hypothetical protein
VQEKILGPQVWNEFLRLIENDQFILSLREKVKVLHSGNDSAKDYDRLKAKLYGLSSQLDSLAERIAILPKAVSPGPLFKQMEKIETHKNEIEEQLLSVRELNLDEKLIGLETFSEFRQIVKKSLSENSDMNIRKMILQKFIKRVEIGPDNVKIHWNVDKEFYENELSQVKTCGSSNLLKFSRNVGSNSLTNGASGETRTRTPFRAADFESNALTNSF